MVMYMNNSVSVKKKKNQQQKKSIKWSNIYIFIFPYPNHQEDPIYLITDKSHPVHKGTNSTL